MELYNSPLSETACLGFEYGYSAASPESLVLWEAQFGDFANSAQVIIDSFIASGESKWGQQTRLTLLLPHGYEGSGPEHSSARIERFIALAAEGNMRLANPTTAAQYFHLLRRQARIAKPRPLVVFTPKGLLRLGAATSTLEDLTKGRFEFVIDDPRAADRRDEVERLVLCSGKVYYDIDLHDKREGARKVAIARVELLYPFAREQISQLIAGYPEPQGDRLGPGGAAEHGRLEGDLAPHARARPGRRRVPLRRPPAARQPERGLSAGAPLRAGANRAHRARGLGRRLPRVDAALRKPVPGALFGWVKIASYVELGLFAALLFFWVLPGFEDETFVFGLAHGLGFLALCLLIWIAVLRREAPYWFLAATLTPVGPRGQRDRDRRPRAPRLGKRRGRGRIGAGRDIFLTNREECNLGSAGGRASFSKSSSPASPASGDDRVGIPPWLPTRRRGAGRVDPLPPAAPPRHTFGRGLLVSAGRAGRGGGCRRCWK